jgi:RNA polymerase sigma factor (sigma-70 family)
MVCTKPLSTDERNAVVANHEGYLHKLCWPYRRQLKYGNTYDDLYSVALLACAKALRRWDADHTKFITYITPAIHREIWNWLHIERRQGFSAINDSTPNREAEKVSVISGQSVITFGGKSTPIENTFPDKRPIPLESGWIESYLRLLPGTRLKRIVEARFIEELTLEEIASEFNVTKDRIRQQLVQALRILRNHKELPGLAK